jgi:hypothetical protein
MPYDLIAVVEKVASAEEIVERIMSQHWDLAACRCWVCGAGRKLGLGARDAYLLHNSDVKAGRVTVEWPDSMPY